jgi:hypothetical protein
MLTVLRRLFWMRRAPPSSPARPPRLPSDSLFDDLRHEAGQGRTAPPQVEDVPEPLSRTLEKVISATKKQRTRAGRRGG